MRPSKYFPESRRPTTGFDVTPDSFGRSLNILQLPHTEGKFAIIGISAHRFCFVTHM